ncbi:3-hydroxyisobutyrate dehydrogenase [Pseudorhodoferax aquiterrae]|uniref:3-hydroxyisobutyrate dehydrogenase n=1 Tax=Pseudorhodoferax aquiterrae TaxID=747304 RepID=A0ABQ3FX39_9BURK|nr:NAD(P)-dependent oxidoreductase [Pseudorhodoferax aquiterrae]GHC71144.1 3-hydroxyisobutyrate dehydrogenase [Pseudorhodoferax aquiterrae]
MRGAPVGLIGLGLVGQAIAQRLRAAGMPVLGHDIRPEARAGFTAQGFDAADSARTLGERCDRVVLAVFDTAGVIDSVEGATGLLAGTAPRTQLLIDCSTGEPDQLQALAGRLAARGLGFVEAPLSGSSEQIAAGQATMLVGTDAATLVRAAPLLDCIAATRVHVGGPGMGARAKLATNLVLGLNRAVLAEGMVFAERLGIAPAAFLELVLATPARSGAAEAKGRMMVEERFAPQSRIRQHLKDVDLMLAAAAAQGQALPLSQTHAALMRAAIAAGDGELDNAAIVRQLRRERIPPSSS